jgi:hypothetical protein
MLALSIRQPWAHMILHHGKDIENRTWPTQVRGRVLIHASKGMTKDEYLMAIRSFPTLEIMMSIPDQHDLQRGGIVGSVEIVDCVTDSDSPWFCGPFGFVLRNPIILPFRPFRGQLGFFNVDMDNTQP